MRAQRLGRVMRHSSIVGMDHGGDGLVTALTISALAVIRLNDMVFRGRQCKSTVTVGNVLGSISAVYGCA